MNFSDDLEDNLNVMIKWLTVASLVAIVIWCLISVVKFVMPKSEPKKTPVNTEMINEDFTGAEAGDEAVRELLGLDENKDDEDEGLSLMIDGDDVQTETNGNHTFSVNIKPLPEKLYFATISNNEMQVKKRQIINQKVGENYIDSVLSYGTIERWNPKSFPLKVYIQKPAEVPASHVNEVKNAFNKWQDTTQGFISFTFVDSADKADIVCTYPADFYRECNSDESSVTSKQYYTYDEDGHITKSNIELTYKDCNDEVYAEDLVYAFALREIGHSLGLRGHSGKFQDKVLYYPAPNKNESVRPEINVADINTLKLIYSVLPDKTNADFSEEQLQKLIRPEEVWGDKVERTPTSEKAILYNIERSPDVPALHIALANYYSKHGEYDKALEVYSKSIVLLNDADFKARVYVRVGDTYSSQQRYLEAIEAYKLSLKTLNNKQNLFSVYFNLGFIYYQQERYQEALQAYQNAIQFVQSKDTFYRLLMNLTEVYIKCENYVDAQKCADKAYSLNKTKDSQYLVGYTRFLNEEYDEAQDLMESSVEQFGGLMDYALLAQIYYKTEQFNKLETLSEQAKEAFAENMPFTFK
ncbi:MAG: tetratricopeptide repeat protein [Fusobacterium sp.]|nr:tetratricopeptide repeat protein [Fusobacterium sp.]